MPPPGRSNRRQFPQLFYRPHSEPSSPWQASPRPETQPPALDDLDRDKIYDELQRLWYKHDKDVNEILELQKQSTRTREEFKHKAKQSDVAYSSLLEQLEEEQSKVELSRRAEQRLRAQIVDLKQQLELQDTAARQKDEKLKQSQQVVNYTKHIVTVLEGKISELGERMNESQKLPVTSSTMHSVIRTDTTKENMPVHRNPLNLSLALTENNGHKLKSRYPETILTPISANGHVARNLTPSTSLSFPASGGSQSNLAQQLARSLALDPEAFSPEFASKSTTLQHIEHPSQGRECTISGIDHVSMTLGTAQKEGGPAEIDPAPLVDKGGLQTQQARQRSAGWAEDEHIEDKSWSQTTEAPTRLTTEEDQEVFFMPHSFSQEHLTSRHHTNKSGHLDHRQNSQCRLTFQDNPRNPSTLFPNLSRAVFSATVSSYLQSFLISRIIHHPTSILLSELTIQSTAVIALLTRRGLEYQQNTPQHEFAHLISPPVALFWLIYMYKAELSELIFSNVEVLLQFTILARWVMLVECCVFRQQYGADDDDEEAARWSQLEWKQIERCNMLYGCGVWYLLHPDSNSLDFLSPQPRSSEESVRDMARVAAQLHAGNEPVFTGEETESAAEEEGEVQYVTSSACERMGMRRYSAPAALGNMPAHTSGVTPHSTLQAESGELWPEHKLALHVVLGYILWIILDHLLSQ